MLLLTLLACLTSPTPDTGEPAAGDSADSGLTDTADTSADTAADTSDTSATDPDDQTPVNHVLASFAVAGRNEGFDLDGDGEVDNAIWVAGAALDPLIAEGLATAQHVGILQLQDVDAWTEDASIRAGLFSASDTDGDPTDNTSGSDTFDAGATVDETGRALISAPTALVAASYTVEVGTRSLPIGSYELEFATGVHVTSAPTATTEVGLLGVGISIDALLVALEAEGVSPEVQNVLVGLADLDLDSDGVPDALSAAFNFTAVGCSIE